MVIIIDYYCLIFMKYNCCLSYILYDFIGTSQSGSGSIVGSNISSCESLSTLLSRDLRFQKTKSNSHKMVFSLSDNNFQESVGTISPTISTTPLTLNSYIQSSCEQNITNRLRHRPYLETCFS